MDDRISNLPDAILCHILSFLPTQQAVATSLLSKQWMPLWRSVPTLYLDVNDTCFPKTEEAYSRFVQSVYAIIHSRDQHQSIQTFRLYWPNSYDPAAVSLWVNAAVQHKVQHLDLSLTFLSYHIPPQTNLSSIFSCTTLVVLRLQHLHLKPFSSVDLPFLKVLHLQDLYFSEWKSLVELLSGCPNLEDLKLRGLRVRNYLTHTRFKTFTKLVRADISAFLLINAVNNVEFLHLHEICSRFIQWPTDRYIFPMFHNLIHVELSYQQYNCDWSQVVELLDHSPKLQVLVINQSFNCKREIGDWQFPPSIPECVQLHLKRCYLNGYGGTGAEFEFATYIMQNGGFLKKLAISSDIAENQKLQMLKQLSSCKWRSANCRLFFE